MQRAPSKLEDNCADLRDREPGAGGVHPVAERNDDVERLVRPPRRSPRGPRQPRLRPGRRSATIGPVPSSAAAPCYRRGPSGRREIGADLPGPQGRRRVEISELTVLNAGTGPPRARAAVLHEDPDRRTRSRHMTAVVQVTAAAFPGSRSCLTRGCRPATERPGGALHRPARAARSRRAGDDRRRGPVGFRGCTRSSASPRPRTVTDISMIKPSRTSPRPAAARTSPPALASGVRNCVGSGAARWRRPNLDPRDGLFQ